MAELIVAMAILVIAIIPLSYSFLNEQRVFRSYYNRAVAMEIIDGELEVLAAGEWRAFKAGSQPYEVRAAAAANLPRGAFILTLAEKSIRLQWAPEARGKGGAITREVVLP